MKFICALLALGLVSALPSSYPRKKYQGRRSYSPYNPRPQFASNAGAVYPFPVKPSQPKEELTEEEKWEKCKVKMSTGNFNVVESTKQENIRVIFILDETGSMSFDKDETINKYNEFLQSQQEENIDGEDVAPKYTLVKFATDFDIVQDDNINESRMLNEDTYNPSSMTALYDAVGCTISAYKEEKFNILVILTDGQENASNTYSSKDVKKMTTKMQNDNKWKIQYLGANQDAFEVGSSIGVANSFSYAQNSAGYHKAYSYISAGVSSNRGQQYAMLSKDNSKK